ncbi:MAG TPA: 3-deoxy-8-phosphooctulonate synthase, partial [Steroidobacteraceae bacterium]|nr:3-deoxy-8-phosphooctulonate synthase [Steroidobacteraceae bacterium]
MELAGFRVGDRGGLFLIAGPCVIESLALCEEVAGQLKELTARLQVPYIFKASFDKANRSSRGSFRGPGIAAGLKTLEQVRRTLKVPV